MRFSRMAPNHEWLIWVGLSRSIELGGITAWR